MRLPRFLALPVVCLLLAACAQLPPRPDLPWEAALPPAEDGTLAAKTAAAEDAHPGQSGFHLVQAGQQAYALRAYSARQAARSLDIQTYIWHADLTGKSLAREALLAADRGVKVRMLVDDMDARAKDRAMVALDQHPGIEVRVFNPLASRSGKAAKAGEFATDFSRLNHRMHNKAWIADNRIALLGGRNLGDEYFSASAGANFIDLELLALGPAVREVSSGFDRFWNSPASYPVSVLTRDAGEAVALDDLRAMLDSNESDLRGGDYARVLDEDAATRALLAGGGQLLWSADWTFVSDDPLKARQEEAERSAVLGAILPRIQASSRRLRVISPYFVPGERGTQLLLGKVAAGVPVDVITNSLMATDVAAVHAGYSRQRDDLLAGGASIWELKPTQQAGAHMSAFGSSGASLHAKALVFDDDAVFVGSYNLDPRSTSLNSEQGLLVSHPQLAAQLIELFDAGTRGTRSWHVTLHDGELRWSDGSREWSHEPEAGIGKRTMVSILRMLPIDSQL